MLVGQIATETMLEMLKLKLKESSLRLSYGIPVGAQLRMDCGHKHIQAHM
jgi:hypothetical protein